jgi:hypothetical protein
VAQPDRRQAQQDAEREASERAARARALAPAYDYIRALVARWEAEDRERESGRENESA